MERIRITSRVIRTEAGQKRRLHYDLLTELLEFDGTQLEMYGLQVVLDDDRMTEIFAVRRISPRLKPVLEMIASMADATVTPICVPEILQELL